MFDFRFKLQQEEYLEFLLYQYSSQQAMRRIRLLLHVSVPLLFLVLVLAFCLWNPYVLTIAVVLSMLYVMVLFPPLWAKLMQLQIEKQLDERGGFQLAPLEYVFGETAVSVNQKSLSYADLQGILPLASEYVVAFRGTPSRRPVNLILPYRLMKKAEERERFENFIESKWMKEWK